MKFTTIILAAGKGTRMKSKLPKVLHKVGGKPMLEQVINVTKQAGSTREIVVIGNGAEKVKQRINGVEFALQAEQLGTGHAVMMTKDKITAEDETVMILCGDTPLITSDLLKSFAESHEQTKAAVTILTAIMPDATGYGRIVRNQSGMVDKIVEHKDASEEELQIHEVNSGMYCFNAKILFEALSNITNENAQGEYYLTDVIGIIREQGFLINAYVTNDFTQIFGINSRLQLATAERILHQRKNFELMENGVTIIDPDTTFIDIDVEIGRDTIIYPFTYIEGKIKIGEDCQIGPFVRIRPESDIANGVKIGNFVEVKNSKIGKGTKLPHLQYIGDSDVGENVNIGCGSVTCNYDGKKKYRSKIGNNVFIGCNTNIVSPVEIGDNAYTAAGSTITQNVPENNLAVGRSRQTNISNWKDKRGE